jgi:DNA adenine methylase
LYQEDALTFVKRIAPKIGADSFIFWDPPYIKQGDTLYMNHYALDDHRALARGINEIDKPWVVTYDFDAVKHGLFSSHRRLVYKLPYAANKRYQGKEAMFFSERLVLPAEWRTGEVLVTADDEGHAVYGRMHNMKLNGEMEEGPLAARRFDDAVRAVLCAPSRKN